MDIGQELACWLESNKPDNVVTQGRGLHKAGPKQNQEVVAGEGWEGPPGGKPQPSLYLEQIVRSDLSAVFFY
jgi:hypothetical protein